MVAPIRTNIIFSETPASQTSSSSVASSHSRRFPCCKDEHAIVVHKRPRFHLDVAEFVLPNRNEEELMVFLKLIVID
jgi:hypothetical protein